MNKIKMHEETILRDGKPDATVTIHSLGEEGQPKQILQIIATVNGKSHEHRILIGSDDKPLPAEYDLTQLERDIEAAKQHAIAMVDGHDRSAGLVEQWAAKKKAEAGQ